MEGYYCPDCREKRDPANKRKSLKTELHYELFHGMRIKREHDGRLMYHAYCPVEDKYLWVEE